MNARRLTICGACAVLAALSAGASAARAPSPVRFKGVGGHAQVRPGTLNLTGDGTLTDVKVHWSSWGGKVAVGHGVADWHGCKPSCAQGKPHRDPATVRLSAIKSCHSGRYYSHATTVTKRGRRFSLGSYAPC